MLSDFMWGTKLALVIVDPQRKFTLTTDDWSERMSEAVKGINEFSRIFRKHGAPVIFIHFDGASHCDYKGDDGDEWLPGIEFCDSDIVVHKSHMSCFKETDLEKVLKDNGVDCAVYVGMLAEFCVVTTYFASAERKVSPFIGKGATIAYYSEGNQAVEVICTTVDIKVVDRFLSGEQPPVSLDF